MKEFLWVEKYRPSKVSETILTKDLKDTFQSIVDGGEIPNMMFTGTAGTGKTTIARAICEELGLDYIVINGSEEGNIDTLRGKIKQFASSVSLSGGYKVVILDEADYLNPQSTQPALRGFIEEFSKNCRFILTCNFKNRIIEPLHSRCSNYEFSFSKKIMAQLCGQFMTRLQTILDGEGVDYNKDVVAGLIMRHAPDWRRVLNEAQRGSIGGSLLTTVIDNDNNSNYSQLFSYIKNKDFKKMRQWVVNNMDLEPACIFRDVYDNMQDFVVPESIPQLVLILADYQYKNAFVADHELNLVACLTEVMANVEIK
jgi:DNA polymerase III delta prime subunit|tara:strand:- start:1748 stop:2683 length:936 start_codon:yes stop_codon:yes gene_type:complete